ncbi:hypothetical protein BGZ88_003656 [Linnemannia elongata]|nr:hypothetical protein BGZ88_003656 [Linnemannia elongata]
MDGSKCTMRRDHEATKVWAIIKRCHNEENILKDSDIFKARRLPSKVKECLLTELEPPVDGFRIMDEAVTNKRSAHGHGVTEYLDRAPTVLESRYH